MSAALDAQRIFVRHRRTLRPFAGGRNGCSILPELPGPVPSPHFPNGSARMPSAGTIGTSKSVVRAMRYGLTERLNEIAGIMLGEEHETSLRKNSKLFDLLTQEQRAALLEIGERRTFEIDQPLFQQGDPHDGIYLIETGRVSSYYQAPSGRQITLAYWFPGNLVGALSIFGGGTRMWGSAAVQRGETIFLPGPDLRRVALGSA
jgi:Cyclic nucleotide-binding domain